MSRIIPIIASFAWLLAACNGSQTSMSADAATPATSGRPFKTTALASFDEPWAMTFLDERQLLITEKKGALKLYTIGGAAGDVSGVPKVAYGGQGGLGDVVLHPGFGRNQLVYLSYAEAGDGGTRGAAVARGKLTLDDKGGGKLSEVKVIWPLTLTLTARLIQTMPTAVVYR